MGRLVVLQLVEGIFVGSGVLDVHDVGRSSNDEGEEGGHDGRQHNEKADSLHVGRCSCSMSSLCV